MGKKSETKRNKSSGEGDKGARQGRADTHFIGVPRKENWSNETIFKTIFQGKVAVIKDLKKKTYICAF